MLDRNRGRAVAVEVKWTRSPVDGSRVLRELRAKLETAAALKALSTTPILISRSGFRDAAAASDCTLIDLRREGAHDKGARDI